MEVLFLGTGSSVFPGNRAHSSILVEINNDFLLLVAGPPLQQRLYEERIPVSKIGLIVITHLHFDHFAGLPGFLHELKAMGFDKSPEIIVPSESLSLTKSLLEALGPSRMEFYLTPANPGDTVERGGVRLYFEKSLHTVPTLAVKLFSIDDELSLFYSSDTAFSPSLSVLARVDVGIHEATIPVDMEDKAYIVGMHSSPRQALKVLEASALKILTHISSISFRGWNGRGGYIVASDGLKINV